VREAFQGKVVLITGACGGFGRAIAKRFAAAGACLVLSDLEAAPLATLAAELDGVSGGTVAFAGGSVTDDDTHARLVGLAVERFGSLDIAINNAGIAHPFARLAQIDNEEAQRVLAVDLFGVFLAMKHQLTQMEAQFRKTGEGGAVVNIASVAGLVGAPGLSVYAAAKHGVVGLTKSAALDYARLGIRINAVCPSFAATAMVTDTLNAAAPDLQEKLVRGVPMRRMAGVDEAVLFAAVPANGFMTGQALAVDGGLSAG
jgi:NAD(P)-dependent dehydrogenase (short-subunit alcohol dehydrogenase family)